MPDNADIHRRKKPVIVSVHDVMPSNLSDILEIIITLRSLGVHFITLLIVPGKDWRLADIVLLRKLRDYDGIELAGHGWRHEVDYFSTLRHRAHGLLISRKEAEHMALEQDQIAGLIHRSYSWFFEAGLKPPDLYVPPAWAMGRISRKQLLRLPYRYYETLFGIYDSYHGKFHPMAVCGYMADSVVRLWLLRWVNALNRKFFFLPLRIAIHPNDLRLRLAGELKAHLKRTVCFSGYDLSSII
jgi:uncharacterized protein